MTAKPSNQPRPDDKRVADAEPAGKVLRMLPCKLTAQEATQRGEELAASITNTAELNAAFELVKGDWKKRIGQAELKTQTLAAVVTSKREDREVECTEWRDYQKNLVYIARDDTNQVVDTRQMTTKERQPYLAEQAAAKEAAGKKENGKEAAPAKAKAAGAGAGK